MSQCRDNAVGTKGRPASVRGRTATSGVAATHSAVPGPSTGSPPASSADPKGCVRYFISSQAEVIPGFLSAKKLVLIMVFSQAEVSQLFIC